jgi:putative PEP-CTERM system histidine kinase
VTPFSAWSYGTAAAGFGLLAILLVAGWRGRTAGIRLITASVLSAAWATGIALKSAGVGLPLVAIYALEMLRNAGWIVVLAGLARGVLPRTLALGSHLLWAGLLAGGLAVQLIEWRGAPSDNLGSLLIRGGLAVAILVLVLLEQVYRNATEQGRYGFKFLAIGLGGQYAYDLFLYSQAELLQGVSIETWAARGFVAALLVPAIAVAARRNHEWALEVFVSRQVVTYTTMVVAAGLYLIVMALGGFYVREAGGSWGVVAQIVFLGGAAAVLAALLLSGTIRRRLQVFISKHFYRNKYDYRIEWLRFVETLSRADERDPRRRGLQAVAQIFNSPGGVFLEFDDRGLAAAPVAAWPMEAADLRGMDGVRRDDPLVGFVEQRGWVIDLEEYRLAPEVYQNMALPGWLLEGGRFRILAPLFAGDRLVGFIALFPPPPPPFDLTFEDRDLLKTVGRHVATHVAQHQADQRLAESRQFEAYNRLTAFMMHDLKNAIAQLQLVVSNAGKHKRNPEFVDDALVTIAGTVDRLNQLVDQLRGGTVSRSVSQVDVVQAVRQALERCRDRAPRPRLSGEPPAGLSVSAEIERFVSVVEHVIRNAQDATDGAGEVTVEVAAADGGVLVTIADNGCGMSAEFVRERLFRPFDSTKGAKGMGIGAYQVREFARALGGDVEVESHPGSGTRFSIKLPCSSPLSGRHDSEDGRASG